MCHLYTDGFFNYDFYRKIKRHPLGEGKNREEKREIKHHDFWLFDTKFHHEFGIDMTEAKEIARKASEIAAVELTGEDLMDVERILKMDNVNDFLKGEKYLFYSEQELANVMEDMVESFANDYLGDVNA